MERTLHALLRNRGTSIGFANLLALAVAVGLAISWIITSGMNLSVHDMEAYWNAAMRLREGEPLYAVPGNPHFPDVYRYAPWFAYIWIPLTYLPQELVRVAWFGVLLAASLAVNADLWRQGHRYLAMIVGFGLFWTTAVGNVQALMIAAIYFSVDRRSGPVWIGLAASLKAVPILYVLVYAGRRQWLRAGVASAICAVLVAPILLVEGYPTETGLTFSPYGWSLPLYAVVAVAFAAYTVVRPTWTHGSLAVLAALPRLLIYDVTYLVIKPR